MIWFPDLSVTVAHAWNWSAGVINESRQIIPAQRKSWNLRSRRNKTFMHLIQGRKAATLFFDLLRWLHRCGSVDSHARKAFSSMTKYSNHDASRCRIRIWQKDKPGFKLPKIGAEETYQVPLKLLQITLRLFWLVPISEVLREFFIYLFGYTSSHWKTIVYRTF